MQVLASYRAADGSVQQIVWENGRFVVGGYEVGLAQVLQWDAAGILGWASPGTRAWAHGLAAPQPQPAPQPARQAQPAPGSRQALLADILATMAQYPGYTAQYGTDTDIRIDNQVALASWGTGKKKIEFSAQMKAIESERTLHYFEVLKEKGAGLSFGGFETESYSTFGTKRAGSTREVVVGPGGVAMDVSWDYGATRQLIESVCARHGWRVKVVLTPGAAKY